MPGERLTRVVIVCGGRDFEGNALDEIVLAQHLERLGATRLRHGDAPGADRFAAGVARKLGLEIDTMPADWGTFGRGAGMRRNRAMLFKRPPPVAVLAFPGNTGTRDMLREARREAERRVRHALPALEVTEIRG